MAKLPVAYGSLQLGHGANNRSGQFIWYINRSIINVIDMGLAEYGDNVESTKVPTGPEMLKMDSSKFEPF
jgi:hypothetical protein